ncbi:DedA family protein [candidate division WS5 bacterium]|uniref:DedA family protein n=1 Tax=candidate division WS5 bacterium TaxID=2093353 RepID=A0A419DFK3_9BACT|nr:MAG: DedA family protein [candidate division WS5 bacterium]
MDIYNFIYTFKYVAIFLGTFIEGPAVGMIVGFLSRTGYINLYLGSLAHILGDISADMMYFFIGYFGGMKIVPRLARVLKYSVSEIESLEQSFQKHSKKLIIVGKLTHVIGFPILFAAGLSRYKWYRFFAFDLVATLIKTTILVIIGYYFGGIWEDVNNVLFIIGGIGIIIVATQLAFFMVRRIVKIKNGDITLDEKELRKLQRFEKRRKR